jgi:hypothetical protein
MEAGLEGTNPRSGEGSVEPERSEPVLDGTRAFSGFSVDNLERAKAFYGETLGLEVSEEEAMGLLRSSISQWRMWSKQ